MHSYFLPLSYLSISLFFVVLGHLELREKSTSQFGLSSSIYAVCDCGMSEFLATGQHNGSDNSPRTVQGKDVNRRVVYAATEMGIGKEDISKFCEILNMPFSMSKDTWHSHEDALLQAHSTVHGPGSFRQKQERSAKTGNERRRDQ